MTLQRKIIHIDMDAFFAAIEQRDYPDYRGKPLVVGGAPNERGVVATASYEARKFGIKSAMSSKVAVRLCPNAIFIKPRIGVYREVSQIIMDILRDFSNLVEPVSIDEAYLDVTVNKRGLTYASEVARSIKREIFEATALSASAGVAPNKFIAKIASDMNKPDGLTVISPERVSALLENLPVRKIPGVGKVTESRMKGLGILSTKDLRRFSEEELNNLFGKTGSWFFKVINGIDERAVVPFHVRKSISVERTFTEDISSVEHLRENLILLSRRLLRRCERSGYSGRTVQLKVTYADFVKITRSKTFADVVNTPQAIEEVALELLGVTEAGVPPVRPVRLLGLGVSTADIKTEGKMSVNVSRRFRQLSFPFYTR